MKFLGLATAAAAFAMMGAQSAAAKPADGSDELRQTLMKMVSQGDQPPGQTKRPDDPDQGDDNASMTAITTVCTMETPAAERSAICDRSPTSPE